MPEPSSKLFHVIIHGRVTYDSEKINNYLLSISQTFIMCGEDSNNQVQHYHIAMYKEKQTKPSHLKLSFNNLLQIKDVDEKKHTVCVKAHNEFQFLLGYVCKDKNVIYQKNVNNDAIESALKLRNEHIEYIDNIPLDKKYSIDQIADLFVSWLTHFQYGSPGLNHYNMFLRTIRGKLTFSNYQKINKEKLLEYAEIHI